MRVVAAVLLPLLWLAATASAETLTLVADRDATLIEEPGGRLANGSGTDLYVGRTAQKAGSVRRALVRFDLSAIPRHARIESVSLSVRVSQASSKPGAIAVHRLLGDWGEGASVSIGGSGAPSAPGDATWIHRDFDPDNPAPPPPPAPPANPRSSQDGRWQSAGGDFVPEPSASRVVPGTGTLTWDGPALAADLSEWLQHPKRNFGWILIGDEAAASTVCKMDSRQSFLPDFHPRLIVRYGVR